MSWDEVGQSAGGQEFVKIESGKKLKLHVLSEEPYSYKSIFFNSINRSAVVGDETEHLIENKKDIRPQHAFLVVTEDGSVKVWQMGNRLAEAVKNIYETYNGLGEVDLVVTRTGNDKATKWGVTPVPAEIDTSTVDQSALPVLEEVLAPTSVEDMEKMIAGIDPAGEFDAEKLERESKAGAEAEPEPEAEEAPEPEAPRPKPKTAPAPAAKGPNPAEQKAFVVREIMTLLSKSVKYRSIQARQALMKKVAPGKSTVGAMSTPELIRLRAELRK